MSLNFGKIRPLLNRIVVKKPDVSKVSKGGIILKQTETVNWGTVVAVGPGRTLDSGAVRPVPFQVGDDVLLPEYGGSTIKMGADQEEFVIYRDDDILGVLEEKLPE